MKRSVLIIGGILMLVLLLAGAAFVGGRLLNKRQAGGVAGGPLAGGGPMGGAPGEVSVSMEVEAAEELPDSPPDVVGPFVRREDNSIFVNDAGGGGMLIVSIEGEASTSSQEGNVVTGGGADTANSQEIEVVVASDTMVYRDVTGLDEPPSGGTVQQKVEPGSIDEIGENSVLVAWGERRGDRLVARVLVYSEPMMLTAPGGN